MDCQLNSRKWSPYSQDEKIYTISESGDDANEDWISVPGVAICACNDGIRPVIFKLEATDIESELDYEPVDYGNRDNE